MSLHQLILNLNLHILEFVYEMQSILKQKLQSEFKIEFELEINSESIPQINVYFEIEIEPKIIFEFELHIELNVILIVKMSFYMKLNPFLNVNVNKSCLL